MGCFGDTGDFVSDTVSGLFGGGDIEIPNLTSSVAQSNPYMDMLAKIANFEFNRSRPVTGALSNYLLNFMGYKRTADGGKKRLKTTFDVSTLPWYQSGKKSIMDSYASAKNDILATLPAGGTLLDSLANARMDAAGTLGDFASNLASDMFNKAYGYATGAPGSAITGLTGASNAYSSGLNTGSLLQGQNNDLLSLLGQGAGSLIGNIPWGSMASGVGDLFTSIPWGSIGSGIGSMFSSIGSLFSTRRVKKNISYAATLVLRNGDVVPMVYYNYHWDGDLPPRIGVIAEDLFNVLPEAVYLDENKKPVMVDYSVLGSNIAGVM